MKKKKNKKIIIVGMGPAASGASMAIQQSRKKVDLTLVNKNSYEMYSPCAMPYAFGGKIGFYSLKHEFPSKGSKATVYLSTEAKKVDAEKKELLIETENGSEVLKYDSLIITTGTKPSIPSIRDIEKFSGIYTVNDFETVYSLYIMTKYNIRNKINNANKISIIGTGATGLEFAMAMKKNGLEVLVAGRQPQVLPRALDKDMAQHVQEYLEGKGIRIITEAEAEKVDGDNKTIESIIINGEPYKTNFVVLACGAKPNIELVEGTAINHNQNGIITDNRMMTNIKDVYAAGDCVETFNFLTKKRCRSVLAVPAMKQGRIAGINAAGGRAAYKGILNTFVSVLDEYAAGSTGMTADQAKAEGYEVIIQKIKGLNKPEWHPESQELIVKLVADKKGKLLGGQAFGEKEAVTRKIDTVSAYLSRNSRLKDITNFELAYCPEIAEIPDPIATAANLLIRKMKK